MIVRPNYCCHKKLVFVVRHEHEGGRPRGVVTGGADGAGGSRDRCAPGRGPSPSVPRRTRAERRGAAARRQRHGARARPRTARRRRARAHRPRAAAHDDMDALSDDDEYARRDPQVRASRPLFTSTGPSGDHILIASGDGAGDSPEQQVARLKKQLACKDDLDRSLRRAVSPRFPFDVVSESSK